MPPKYCIRISHNAFNLLSPTSQCYYLEILVFHSIRHQWYVVGILVGNSLARGLMTSRQQIARCYLSRQWKTCLKAKFRLLSIMIFRLRSYRLTSKNHLPVIIKFTLMATAEKEAAYRWGRAQKKEQEEMLRDPFELSEIGWYVGVVILSVYLIFSRCKGTCCNKGRGMLLLLRNSSVPGEAVTRCK